MATKMTTANNNSKQQQQTTTARDITYDWLRIFATLFVVIGHSSYLSIHTETGGVSYVLPEGISAVYYSVPFRLVRLMGGWVYGFHMPLFFILSGAVFALKPAGEISSVIRAKAERLLIPYIVCGYGFMFPVKFMGDFYSAETIGGAMLRFIYGGEAGHLWFLPALFWCFAVFSVLRRLTDGSSVKILVISCAISSLSACVPSEYILLGLRRGMRGLAWFSAGYIFGTERIRFKPLSVRMILSAAAAVCVLEAVNIRYRTPAHDLAAVILGSSLTYMLSVLCAGFFRKASCSECWNIIVRNLFCVYLFHDPLEYIVLKIFMKGGYLTSGAGCAAYLLSRTLAVFIISILLGELARRVKCHLNFSRAAQVS